MRISSAVVPHSILDRYLDHVRTSIIPVYESAADLISLSVFQRPVVGYVELLTLTMWQSDQALTRFLEDNLATDSDRSSYGVIHMEPQAFELVESRQGTRQIAEDLQGQ
jgi:hypothetical protein